MNEELVRKAGTSGINVGVDTEDIIARLRTWSDRFGAEVVSADAASVQIRFTRLPEDLGPLGGEIETLCPDIIHQHYGCFDEMFDSMEAAGVPINPADAALAEGIDFADPSFPQTLLQRALARDKSITLWWD